MDLKLNHSVFDSENATMSNAKPSWSKWSMFSLTVVALAALCVPAFAQAPAVAVGDTQITGRINDWTMHHVVFPDPGTEQEAVQSGHYDEWLKIVNDPRYVMQQLKRNAPVQGPAASLRGPFPRGPRFPLGPLTIEPASALKKDWSMQSGAEQPVSLTFTVNSVSATTVSSSSTFTIDGQTLTGSAPVAASATGTFSSAPTSNASTISLTVGSDTLNLTTNATGFASATANVSAIPASASTTVLSIVNNDGTVNMTPTGATAAPADTVTFTAMPTSASSNVLSIVNSAGTVNMTPSGATAASAGTVTVSAVPASASSNVLSIANGDGTVNMAPTGATAAPADTVTFTAMPTSASSNVLSIGNGDGTVNMAPTGATAASAGTVTVSALPTSASSSVLTIVNGDGTVSMAPSGASALTGTVTVSAVPTSASSAALSIVNSAGTVNMTPSGATAATTTATFSGPGTAGSTSAKIVNGVTGSTGVTLTGATGTNATAYIQVASGGTGTGSALTVGGVTYTFLASGSTCTTAPCIVASGTVTTAATNIEEAIDNSCSGATVCLVSGPNPEVSAGAPANPGGCGGCYRTALTNRYYTSVTVSASGTGLSESGSPIAQGTANGCSASAFIIGTGAAGSAENLYGALTSASCQADGISSTGTTNPSGSTLFTVADSVLGYATFATGGTGLSLSPANAGSNGSNSCTTPSAGAFLLAPASTVPTTSTVATGLQGALNACGASGISVGTPSTNTFTLSDTVLGYATFTPLSGITTVTSPSGGSNGTANSCTTPGSGTFLLAGASTVPTTSTAATGLQAALAACTSSGISVGTVTTNTFTLADTALGYATFTPLSGITMLTGGTAGSNGTANSCTTPTSGTFILNTAGTVPTTSTAATQLQSALSGCSSSGLTLGGVTTNHFTVADSVLGYATFGALSGVTTVSAASGGSNGTANSCTAPGSGTFLLAGASTVPTTSTAATGLQAALSACSTSGISVGTVSSNTFTLADTALGYATFTPLSGITTVANTTGGSNGTGNSCTTPSAGTFTLAGASTVPSTSTAATQLQAALAACSSPGFTLGTVTSNHFTVTDSVLGYATFTPLTNVTAVSASTGGSNGTANSCATPGAGTFLLAGASTVPTTSTAATGLQAALSACSTSGISVGTVTGSGFTLTDTALGYATFTPLSGITMLTGGTAGSNGTANSCTTPTSGTFILNTAGTVPTTSTAATQLQAALSACSSPGFTAGTVSSNTFPLTDTVLGYATFTPLTGITTVTATSGGSNGTANSCTTPGSGTFLLAGASIVPTTSTVTTELQAALSACSSSGFTTGGVTSNTFPVTDTVLGAATFTGSADLSWTGVANGNNGSYSCSGSAPTFTATYASGPTATLASNLSSAIKSCNASTLGITSTYASGSSFTVADATPGTGGNGGTLSPTAAGYFSWSSGSLTGGSDGTTSATNFKYWTTSAYDTPALFATDLYNALKDNTTITGAFTLANGSNSVTITDKTAGTGDYSQFATVANMTALNFLGEVNLTGGVAPNSYPALYSSALGTNFDTGVESCSDFVVYPAGVLGSGTQATVIAYTGLYLGGNCSSATGPAVSWAYNTGGVSTLSPTPSLDGTQVAYIQSTGGVASLVILTPEVNQGGSFGAPNAPTLVSNASYRGCTAPCYTTIPFSNSANDTNSSPFYDYASATADTLWVGDDNGYLHEFTGVFLGTPAENTTHWPVNVDAGYKLTGPVYDPTSTFVFVGDSKGVLSSVSMDSTPVLTQTPALSASGSLGIVDAPMVDELTSGPKVYAFVGDDGTTNCGFGSSPCAWAYQFSTALEGEERAEVSSFLVGGAATLPIFAGAFDNLHYDIASGTGGNLYVCGVGVVGLGAGSELYEIPMSGTFGSATTHTRALGAATEVCSPVTEFLASKAGSANTNLTDAIGTGAVTVTVGSTAGFAAGDYVQIDSEIMLVATPITATTFTVAAGGRGEFGTAAVAHGTTGVTVQDIQDYLYLSIPAGGGSSICTGACLANFLVTTGSTTIPAATATIPEAGGTTGIVVDNYLTGTDESNIYYSTNANQACAGNGTSGSGTGICAIQVSQTAP
jgi:hypothetical protein